MNDQSSNTPQNRDPSAAAEPAAPPTRERIIDAAMRLFHEQGFAGTGVSTILREAKVNSGSLYHHFASKEALLEAVLERYTQLLDPVVMGPRRVAQADPIERIFTLLMWYRQGLSMTGCALGCPIGNLALEISDHHPGARELVQRNFAGWRREIERWLVEAGERLPSDLDRRALSHFVLTVMEGAVMQARAERSLAPYDASVAMLRDYLRRLERQASIETPHNSARASGAQPRENQP